MSTPHSTADFAADPRAGSTSGGTARPSSFSRRKLLQRAAALGGAMAVPYVVPGSVLGLNGAAAPSERIVMGGLGIRSRGSYDLKWMIAESDVQFVAICDTSKLSREKVKGFIDGHYGNTDCKMYPDMREFLAERSDIDGLLIATGDRWHALAAVMAMKAGKDVYSEKPSSMTMAEGQAVVDAANRYRRIYQTGTQRLSEGNFTFANEMLRLGRLGQVHTVRAHIAPWDAAEMRHDWLPAQPEPSRDELDWDQWLGPCPWRPFNSAYVTGGWRGHYDFHTSCIGEWGAHTFAQCQVAIGAGDTSAIEYSYVDNPYGEGMVARFANGINMILNRDMEKKFWHGSCGVRYEGTEGWIAIADGYAKPELSNAALLNDFEKVVRDYQDRTQRAMSHVRNFFDCVKSRKPTVANADVMHRSMATVHAANICMWLRRNMKFDPVKQEFINDAEANRLRSRAMREPWIF